jgi:hypothetical protein
MTYEQVAIVLNVGTSLLEKMVNDGRFRQGRHFIRMGTNVRFVKNLVALICEDQLNLEETLTAEPETKVSKSRQAKRPEPQQPRKSQRNNPSGFAFGYADRAASGDIHGKLS